MNGMMRGNRGQKIDPEYEAMYANATPEPAEQASPTMEEDIAAIIQALLTVTGLAEQDIPDDEKIAQLRQIVEQKMAGEEQGEAPEQEAMEQAQMEPAQ